MLNLIKRFFFNKINAIAFLYFLSIGLVLFLFTIKSDIGDFGNYYFGSLFFLDNNFGINDYEHIELFNRKVRALYSDYFFLNYSPVPPPTLLFYIPFVVFSPINAKLIFNLLGILFFSFSAARFVKQNNGSLFEIILTPILLLYPYYHCLAMGQTYLFIGATMLEVFIWNNKQKHAWCGLAISTTVLLKLFPIFIIVFFILKKNYKVVFWFLFWLLVSLIFCFVFIGQELLLHYYLKILPRMLANDAIGAFENADQSMYTLLLKIFVFDKLNNPEPYFHIPFLVPFLESIIIAIIISVLFAKRREENLTFFSLVLIAGMLIGRYNPIYMQMMFFVPAFYFLKNKQKHYPAYLFFAATHFPIITHFFSSPEISFGRVIMYFILFLISASILQSIGSIIKTAIVLFILVFLFKFQTFSISDNNYFYIQNSKGLLYSMEMKGRELSIKSTLGSKEQTEKFVLKENVSIKAGEIKNNELILNGHSNKFYPNENVRCPFVLNDSLLVYLSDRNQGYGFYKIKFKKMFSL